MMPVVIFAVCVVYHAVVIERGVRWLTARDAGWAVPVRFDRALKYAFLLTAGFYLARILAVFPGVGFLVWGVYVAAHLATLAVALRLGVRRAVIMLAIQAVAGVIFALVIWLLPLASGGLHLFG